MDISSMQNAAKQLFLPTDEEQLEGKSGASSRGNTSSSSVY